MNCLHAPHGGVGLADEETMAIALKRLLCLVTAATIAERSAQMLRPNDEFSTFTPVITSPSSVSRAAATENPE